MVSTVTLWSQVLTPGEELEFSPPIDLKITNIALGEEIADEKSRTSVKLVYRDPTNPGDSDGEGGDLCSTILCSLTPGKIEQATIDLVLEQKEDFLFVLIGKNPVYLTGNYIDQGLEDDNSSEGSYDSDEEGYPLEDFSSDVEVDPDELEIPSDEDDSHRFEEVVQDGESEEDEEVDQLEEKPTKNSKKRPRDSDAMDVEDKPSKDEQKKGSKKLKGEAGKAVPTGTEEKPSEVKGDGEQKDEKKKKKKKEKKGKEPESKKDGEAKTKDGEAKGETGGDKKPQGETLTLAGGLKVKDFNPGDGRKAKKGDTVSVRYVGKLENGKIFDSNTTGKPFTFRLGAKEVIAGWDKGIEGMQAGGERLLVIPPALAYGKQKQSGIPPNSTLKFEVKLLKIK